MKRIMSLLLAGILTLSVVGCSSKPATSEPAAEGSTETTVETPVEKIKLIAAHNQTNVDSPYQTGMLAFEESAEASGLFDVEVHAGTIGTNEDELVEKLKLGAADVVLVSPGFMTKTGIKEVDLFALLYLFNNYEHWEKVVDGDVGAKMAQTILEKSNNEFKIVGYWSAGVRHYYGKQPVNTMADLEGLKIRTQTSGAVSEFWTATGAIPTSVAWGELYQALQQGTVDAAENAYPYLVPMDHHKTENGKYLSETGHDYTTRFLLVNGIKFDAMTEEQKTALLAAATAATAAERQAIYDDEASYKQQAIDDGAIINELDREPFIELATPMQDALASELGLEDLLQEVRDLK